MVWYVPPRSPIQSAVEAGLLGEPGVLPDVKDLRIPVKYLANLLTAGDEAPVVSALERMVGMPAFMRSRNVEGFDDPTILEKIGMTEEELTDMYKLLAIANYEDRFVIPTNHKEYAGDTPFDGDIAFETRSECGFSFGNGCAGGGPKEVNLFGTQTHENTMSGKVRDST